MAQTGYRNVFSKTFNDLNNFSLKDINLGGNFNLVLSNNFDEIGGATQYSIHKNNEVVHSHMRTINFSDCFCSFHPYKKIFTRIQVTQFTNISRLDFIFVSNFLTHSTRSTNRYYQKYTQTTALSD